MRSPSIEPSSSESACRCARASISLPRTSGSRHRRSPCLDQTLYPCGEVGHPAFEFLPLSRLFAVPPRVSS